MLNAAESMEMNRVVFSIGRGRGEGFVDWSSILLNGRRGRDGRHFIGAGAFLTVIGTDRKVVKSIRIKVGDRG